MKTETIIAAAAGLAVGYFAFRKNDAAVGASLRSLLKDYDFSTERQYHEMIVESLINGQRTQAKEQFLALPKMQRKAFVNRMLVERVISDSDIAIFVTLI